MALEPTTSAAPTSVAPVTPTAAAVSVAPASPAADAAPSSAVPSPAVVDAAPAAASPTETPATPEPDATPTPAADAPAAEPAAETPAADAPADAPVEGAVEAAAPKQFEFTIPETVKADPATMSAYNNVLGKYSISQEAGQELLDFHANAMKTATDQMTQHQLDVWAETNSKWQEDFKKSAGNRYDTILNDAKFAFSDTIKDVKERKAVWAALEMTGAANHPTVINAMSKIGKRLREGSARSAGAPNTGAKTGNPADRRYGGANKTQG